MKWALVGLGALVGALLIVVAALVGYEQVAYGRTYERDLYPITADTSPEGIRRGEYLVESVVAFSGWHSEKVGGALIGKCEEVALGPVRMTITDSNPTPDEETGLGAWIDAEIARTLCEGYRLHVFGVGSGPLIASAPGFDSAPLKICTCAQKLVRFVTVLAGALSIQLISVRVTTFIVRSRSRVVAHPGPCATNNRRTYRSA